MREIIYWRNRKGINGWGDTLTRLSFLYRSYENKPVKCFYQDKNWTKVNFIRKHILKRNTNFIMASHHIQPFDLDEMTGTVDDWIMPKHEYWPARYEWNGKRNGRVAYHFYTDNFPKEIKIKLNILEFQNKEYTDNFSELLHELYSHNIPAISLYDLNNHRGCTRVIENPIKCIQANMQILSECDLFIASEGFMTHIARAMKVPTLVYFNPKQKNMYQIQREVATKKLIEVFDKSIQFPVYNNSEIMKKILDICT